MAPTAAGRTAAKFVGINVDYRHEHIEPLPVADSVEPYNETEPTVGEWFAQFKPTAGGSKRYLASLFPFWSWIFHYNFTWLAGDIIAGTSQDLFFLMKLIWLRCNCWLRRHPPGHGLRSPS